LTLLKRAKAGELANSSVPSPSDEDIIKTLTKKEQDQESVQLYARTGTKSKGRIELPVFLCQRLYIFGVISQTAQLLYYG